MEAKQAESKSVTFPETCFILHGVKIVEATITGWTKSQHNDYIEKVFVEYIAPNKKGTKDKLYKSFISANLVATSKEDVVNLIIKKNWSSIHPIDESKLKLS